MARIRYTYKSYPNCPRATEYSRERERGAALLSGLVGVLSIGAVIAFFVCTFSLFVEGNWGDFFAAVFCTILVAFFDAYIFVLRGRNTECKLNMILFEESAIIKMNHHKEQMQTLDAEKRKEELSALKKHYIEQRDSFKKENQKENLLFLKKYFLYFFLGMFLTIAIVGIIQGFIFVANGDDATALLLFSFLAFLGFGCLFFVTLPIGKTSFEKIFVKKKVHDAVAKQPHKTIEKFFCRKCGTQILPDSLYCDKCGEKVETI